MELTDRGALRALLTKYQVPVKKSLGQNFLVNRGICEKIAKVSGAKKGVGVLEVGPGVGSLTAALARKAEKVVSIELDRDLLPLLKESLSGYGNVVLLQGDALSMDLASVIKREFSHLPLVFCANLPYYITSPLLMKILEERLPFSSLTVMVQKEAAKRLCARPGSREAGAISYAVRYYAEPRLIATVSPGSFWPQPKVHSAIVQLTLRSSSPCTPQEEKKLFLTIKIAFSQRRKMLLGVLAKNSGKEKEEWEKIFTRLSIPKTARAEELTLSEYIKLSQYL